ncbi:hypothetical protein FB470_002989 [Amycolatopsis thermophila]|uniref:Uncharacterized protein n=1 Tax=Amycolatopsis thermophila TaxID=206084 RepID=A0ABU0EUK7_9PSEU|nr:hypothetical protein [Amycolatopsis thermophila]
MRRPARVTDVPWEHGQPRASGWTETSRRRGPGLRRAAGRGRRLGAPSSGPRRGRADRPPRTFALSTAKESRASPRPARASAYPRLPSSEAEPSGRARAFAMSAARRASPSQRAFTLSTARRVARPSPHSRAWPGPAHPGTSGNRQSTAERAASPARVAGSGTPRDEREGPARRGANGSVQNPRDERQNPTHHRASGKAHPRRPERHNPTQRRAAQPTEPTGRPPHLSNRSIDRLPSPS